MRDDMSRVIVERPRLYGDCPRKGRSAPFDELPSNEGMRRPHSRNQKCLNENLSPLRRFLERQAGRPWAKVYSEICRNLRVANAVQQHVRDHIRDFVALDPRRDVRDAWGLSPWRQPLYVDPKDGILKRTDDLPDKKARRQRKFTPAAPDTIVLDADRQLQCIKGLWYEFNFAPEANSFKRSLSRAELRRHGLQNTPENDR